MPTRRRVEDFVAHVQGGRYVEAIEAFYAEDATMRENGGAPRGGRDALVRHERNVLAGVSAMRTAQVGPVIVDGDHVAIRWVFEFTPADGSARRLDELALQTWRGDRIAEEQFDYDPAQLTGGGAS
jgi:hypothetical protein